MKYKSGKHFLRKAQTKPVKLVLWILLHFVRAQLAVILYAIGFWKTYKTLTWRRMFLATKTLLSLKRDHALAIPFLYFVLNFQENYFVIETVLLNALECILFCSQWKFHIMQVNSLIQSETTTHLFSVAFWNILRTPNETLLIHMLCLNYQTRCQVKFHGT